MITLYNVSKTYNGEKIIDNISYQFKPGIYKIEGGNGTGKTTLFEIITGITDTDGTVEINGNSELSSDQILTNHITYITQEDKFFEQLTVEDNIKLITGDKTTNLLNDYLRRFDIEHLLESKVKLLSGGERKKLQIAIMLSFERNILLLDEAENYLDSKSVNTLKSIIKNFQGLLLYTSHASQLNEDYRKLSIVLETEHDNQVKVSKSNEQQTFKPEITKFFNKSYSFMFILLVLLISVWSIGYLQYRRDNIYATGSHVKYFSDKVITIEPPVYNYFGAQFSTKEWYQTTPFFLTPEFKNYTEQLDHVTNVEILPQSLYVFAGFEQDGIVYYADDDNFITSELPYEIANKLTLYGYPPEYLEGELPRDDADQIVIPKSYAESQNLNIGDQVPISAENENGDTVVVDYQIVGFHNMPESADLIGSHQTNSQFTDTTYNDFEHQIRMVENSTIDNKVSKTIDLSDTYYFGLMVEVDEAENVLTVIEQIKEYDPYLSVSSNLYDSTSLLNLYKKEKTRGELLPILIFICSYIIILSLIFINFGLNKFHKEIAPKFRYYGFSQKEIKMLGNKIKSSYIKKLLKTSFLMLPMLLVFRSMFSFVLIIYVYFAILIVYIFTKIKLRG